MKIAMLNICKNEMKFIKNYFKKNKDADYICLLDTGSTDGTWEYLQEQAKTNPKLIIQQKIYDNFRFDIARNDSLKLLPKDIDLIVQLDLDEYFQEENWVELLKERAHRDNKKYVYETSYLNNSSYKLNQYAIMTSVIRIFTPGFIYYTAVHEILSDKDKNILGFDMDSYVQLKDLLIIHNPDIEKERLTYIDLLYTRINEIIPNLHYDHACVQEDSYISLVADYYRNNMFTEAQEIFNNHLKDNPLDNFLMCPYMYLMTNDISYLRNQLPYIKDNYYNDYLLYYSLKDDFEYCKQYKQDILNCLTQYDKDIPDQFKQYDQLCNIIKEMTENL